MSWFKRERKPMEAPDERRVVTEGLWIKCNGRKEPLWKKDLESNLQVCPKCNHHYKISAYDRINLLMDPGWTEHDGSLYSTDPLDFKANKPYKESLASLPEKIGVQEAVVTVQGTMDTIPVVLSAMEYNFIAGSMGSVVGEKITRVIEQTIRQKLPDGFQRSEFLLQHGMIDAIVHRKEMKAFIAKSLRFFVP